MSAVLAAPSLLARFETAITFLCQSVAANFLKTPAAPLVPLAWNRLRRLLARFAALVACIEAGRNLARRAPAAAGARSRPDLPSLRLPADRGWLLRLAPALDTRLGRGWSRPWSAIRTSLCCSKPRHGRGVSFARFAMRSRSSCRRPCVCQPAPASSAARTGPAARPLTAKATCHPSRTPRGPASFHGSPRPRFLSPRPRVPHPPGRRP